MNRSTFLTIVIAGAFIGLSIYSLVNTIGVQVNRHYVATQPIVSGSAVPPEITSSSIVALINAQRTSLSVLSENPALDDAAKDVLTVISTSIDSSTSQLIDPNDVLKIGKSHGVIVIGELFGARATTVQSLITAWLNTPETKEQIINKEAATIGVAIDGNDVVVLLGR